MHRIIRTKAYEAEHGPHFNEEHARKAVSKMEMKVGGDGRNGGMDERTPYGIRLGIRLEVN